MRRVTIVILINWRICSKNNNYNESNIYVRITRNNRSVRLNNRDVALYFFPLHFVFIEYYVYERV